MKKWLQVVKITLIAMVEIIILMMTIIVVIAINSNRQPT